MSLDKILLESKNLSLWLHNHTNESEFNNLACREKAAICLFQQALDVEDGIRVLLEKDNNLPGPALALARPLFECFVRGIWLLHTATDNEVDKFLSGEYYSIKKLSKDIGNDPKTSGGWINAIYLRHREVMNDLTHGGTSHINSRCFSNTIEPNYCENHLISLVILGIQTKILIGYELLAKLQKEDALNTLSEKTKGLNNLFQIICPDVSN